MPTDDCRISKLEAHLEDVVENFKAHCEREELLEIKREADAKERLTILLEVRDKQLKMNGFWAGAMFVISGIVGAITLGLNLFFSTKGH